MPSTTVRGEKKKKKKYLTYWELRVRDVFTSWCRREWRSTRWVALSLAWLYYCGIKLMSPHSHYPGVGQMGMRGGSARRIMLVCVLERGAEKGLSSWQVSRMEKITEGTGSGATTHCFPRTSPVPNWFPLWHHAASKPLHGPSCLPLRTFSVRLNFFMLHLCIF